MRTRLTTSFLAMVLGPVVLGALFVGVTVNTVSANRAAERMDHASSAVRTSIGSLCAQLRTVAEAIVAAPVERRLALGAQFVERGLVSGVHLEGNITTTGTPPPPWADCAGPGSPRHHEAITAHEAIAAYAGPVAAAFTVDADFVRRLSEASGARITLLPGANPQPAVDNRVGMGRLSLLKERGDLVRKLEPVAGQPLPLELSVPTVPPGGLFVVLILVVLACAVAAVVVAWWLARATTNPLAGLAAAADRVAAGALETRVPAGGKDEIGRLANAFNHMTRELGAYVNALTASRDQLRGHLGVLGDTLSSTHDLDRILQVILQTARHATGASSGVVLLASSAEGVLLGQCSEGIALPVRVPIGAGLVGSVAATGVPRIGKVDRDGPRLDESEPACGTYVVVPFCLSENVGAQGVLALYDRLGRDEFDDSDLDTLRTFAGQASVAVDNVRIHEEAQRLSVTDSLTGLFNYRSLRDSLRRETDRAGRFGRRLAVLALDLDHFKHINDRYGHAAGDAVLAEFAQRIRYEIREVDVAFRQGGEEFALLLPESDEVGGMAVAERLCDAIRKTPIHVSELTISVTVSIGVAVFPDHGKSGPAVLRAADEALYAAKTAGRDTFRVAGEGGLVGIGGASGGPQAPRQASGR